jgi:hypothetical protein
LLIFFKVFFSRLAPFFGPQDFCDNNARQNGLQESADNALDGEHEKGYWADLRNVTGSVANGVLRFQTE